MLPFSLFAAEPTLPGTNLNTSTVEGNSINYKLLYEMEQEELLI